MLWRSGKGRDSGGRGLFGQEGSLRLTPLSPRQRRWARLLSGGLGLLPWSSCTPLLASEVSDRPVIVNAALARAEDRSLHARLGGPAALAAIAEHWAEGTQARTRLAYSTAVQRAQYLLACTVGHGRQSPPPDAPPPPLLLDEDSPAELVADLERTLRHFRITAPEQAELLQKMKHFLRSQRP